MISRRRHDQRNGDCNESNGRQMKALLIPMELFRERRIEDRYELKPKQRLNARQHHAAFFQKMSHRIGARFALDTLLRLVGRQTLHDVRLPSWSRPRSPSYIFSASEPSTQGQNDHNQKNQSNSAARVISPPRAVRPGWQHSN